MFEYKNVKINIKEDDITNQEVDAIVNAANNTLLGGGGVDGAIHSKGGHVIIEQCKKIGGCPTGESRITTGGNLAAKYVIHTVGPIYKDGSDIEKEFLYNAYLNSLKLANEYNLKTISFPSISTGAYGYPINEAVKVVVSSLKDFLNEKSSLEEVNLVLYNKEDFHIYIEVFSENFK